MSILPLVWEKSQCGERPTVIVGYGFSDLLDGILYADRMVWTGNWEDVAGAVVFAREKYDEVFVTQVHGNYPSQRLTECYCKDMWAQVGRLDWGGLPLVFDNRNPEREELLRFNLGMENCKIVLSLNGSSSKLEDRLAAMIRSAFPGAIDVSDVTAERIYDLLGVFDRASVLITVDTASMHLAHASNVPVIALVSDAHHGWGATSRYPGQMLRVNYSAIPPSMERIREVAAKCVAGIPQRHIWHVWSDRVTRDPDAEARHQLALNSWQAEYRRGPWTGLPVCVTKRTSAEIHDPKPVPLINEIIEAAASQAGPNDLIVVTNEDIHFAPGLTDTLMKFRAQCGWSHRRDFKSINRDVSQIGLSAGLKYPGIDFFVFTRDWWRSINFPEMWLGRQKWDLVMKAAMRLSDGIEIYCATAHEQHPSFWSTGNNENTNPANLWNARQADYWQAREGVTVHES